MLFFECEREEVDRFAPMNAPASDSITETAADISIGNTANTEPVISEAAADAHRSSAKYTIPETAPTMSGLSEVPADAVIPHNSEDTASGAWAKIAIRLSETSGIRYTSAANTNSRINDTANASIAARSVTVRLCLDMNSTSVSYRKITVQNIFTAGFKYYSVGVFSFYINALDCRTQNTDFVLIIARFEQNGFVLNAYDLADNAADCCDLIADLQTVAH